MNLGFGGFNCACLSRFSGCGGWNALLGNLEDCEGGFVVVYFWYWTVVFCDNEL